MNITMCNKNVHQDDNEHKETMSVLQEHQKKKPNVKGSCTPRIRKGTVNKNDHEHQNSSEES